MADDNQNGELERARERKRAAANQAVKGEEDRFAAEDEPTGDTKASAETLAGRRILRVKRPEGAGSATGLFANVNAAKPAVATTASSLVTRGFGGAAAAPSAPSAAVPNPFALKTAPAPNGVEPDAAKPTAVSPTSLNARPEAGGIPSVFGANSNFKFSFSAPPQPAASPATSSPSAPTVTAVAASSSQPALQQQETVEDPTTRTLCAEPLKLYHKAGAEWVERGDVSVKVVVNTAGEKPWAAAGAFAAKTKRQVLSVALGGGLLKVGARADRQVTVVVMEDGKAELYIFRAAKDADARVAALLAAIEAAEKEVAAAKKSQ